MTPPRAVALPEAVEAARLAYANAVARVHDADEFRIDLDNALTAARDALRASILAALTQARRDALNEGARVCEAICSKWEAMALEDDKHDDDGTWPRVNARWGKTDGSHECAMALRALAAREE